MGGTVPRACGSSIKLDFAQALTNTRWSTCISYVFHRAAFMVPYVQCWLLSKVYALTARPWLCAGQVYWAIFTKHCVCKLCFGHVLYSYWSIVAGVQL